VQAALHEVEGTYGIAVICKDEPDTLVVARKGSPLIIGVGKDEYVVASDASAIVEHTTQVIYLNDNEMAVLKPDSSAPRRSTTSSVSPVISQLENKLEEYELGDYEHYMLKEIFEQPTAIATACAAAPSSAKGGSCWAAWPITPATGAGQAIHPHRPGNRLARGAGRRLSAGRSRQGRHRMHLRQRVPLSQSARRRGHGVVAISQSGETADTLAALREGRKKARWPWAWSTSSAAPSPAKPTPAFICTPARKSASPAPRRSPASARC
jgi:glucosamine--fructose-6-phosphate aminotransferase (isomerizing)